MNAGDIANFLAGYVYAAPSESALQTGVAEALAISGVLAQRERRLSDTDRIDFYVPAARTGIECKTDGSPNTVMRQLLRYTESELIDGLVLVTTRQKHRIIPSQLGGKPVHIVMARAF